MAQSPHCCHSNPGVGDTQCVRKFRKGILSDATQRNRRLIRAMVLKNQIGQFTNRRLTLRAESMERVSRPKIPFPGWV